MGRKAHPTVLKLARGLPGHRNPEPLEPQPISGAPPMPVGLDAATAAEWKKIIALLGGLGLLSVDCGPILERYCMAYAHEMEAERIVKAEGLIKESPQGFCKHPALGVAKEWCLIAIRCLTELGLTPSARTGVKSIKRRGDEEDLATFAKKKSG